MTVNHYTVISLSTFIGMPIHLGMVAYNNVDLIAINGHRFISIFGSFCPVRGRALCSDDHLDYVVIIFGCNLHCDVHRIHRVAYQSFSV